MQTKLRILGLLVVASLLWTSQTAAATEKVNAYKAARRTKINYIGTASWYGEQHQGRKMANGKRFDRRKLTAASWYFPLGTSIRVVNLENGKSVVVTITDRGPNLRLNRILDLSEAAADHLGYVQQGLTAVFLSPLPPFSTEPAALDSALIAPHTSKAAVEYEAKALNIPM